MIAFSNRQCYLILYKVPIFFLVMGLLKASWEYVTKMSDFKRLQHLFLCFEFELFYGIFHNFSTSFAKR